MPNSAPTDSGLLSVVLPAFNEEEMAPRAADVISALLEQAQIPHELIFVDDGSRDRTWETIQAQTQRYAQVRGVRFSRNFGKEAAIFAGLAQARGDFLSKLCKGVTQEEFAAFFSMVEKMVDNLGDMPLEDELRLENEFEKGSVKGQ